MTKNVNKLNTLKQIDQPQRMNIEYLWLNFQFSRQTAAVDVSNLNHQLLLISSTKNLTHFQMHWKCTKNIYRWWKMLLHIVMVSINWKSHLFYKLVKWKNQKLLIAWWSNGKLCSVHFEWVGIELGLNLNLTHRIIFFFFFAVLKNSFGKLTPFHAINVDLMGKLMIYLINKYKINESIMNICACVSPFHWWINTKANKIVFK